MTIAYWCVLIAFILPLVWTGVAKSAGGYDNRAPRRYLGALAGWPQRADWAHQNAFEAAPPFAAGVIIAQHVGVGQATVDALALVFLLARIAHGAVYLADWDRVRSIIWLVGFGATVGLFLSAA